MKKKEPCQYCDGPGNPKTYENQAQLPLNGRVVGIDRCIHKIVAALNAANIPTVASCCGHEVAKGMIELKDGRVLIILPERPKGDSALGEAVELNRGDYNRDQAKWHRDQSLKLKEDAIHTCDPHKFDELFDLAKYHDQEAANYEALSDD